MGLSMKLPVGKDFNLETDKMPFSKVLTNPMAIQTFRLMTLRKGLIAEVGGTQLTSGRSCYAIVRDEFDLRGNRERVLEQFDVIVDEYIIELNMGRMDDIGRFG